MRQLLGMKRRSIMHKVIEIKKKQSFKNYIRIHRWVVDGWMETEGAREGERCGRGLMYTVFIYKLFIEHLLHDTH